MGNLSDWWSKHGIKKIGKDQLIVVILSGVLLLVIAWPTGSNGRKQSGQSVGLNEIISSADNEDAGEMDQPEDLTSYKQEEDYAEVMEQKVSALLQDIDGVGEARVLITLETSVEKVVEKDIPINRSNTDEKDAQGGMRTINSMDSQEKTIYETDSGKNIPYVIKTISPKVAGVVVVCEGEGRGNVNKNITDAIEVLFGIEAHKIKIVKMKTS